MNKKIFFLIVILSFIFSQKLYSQSVRITTINNIYYGAERPDSIYVRPFDIVRLSANLFAYDINKKITPLNLPKESFIWIASDYEEDICDPSYDCFYTSNFEVTQEGVKFYVSDTMGEYIDIIVKFKWGGESELLIDKIRLINGERFNFKSELNPYGSFITIENIIYFVPKVYVNTWTPFRNGYWVWTSYGWTWVPLDPWGYVTDHCGHWRHHRYYGWIWEIPSVCMWVPSPVTWFYGDTYIGWFPYDPDCHYKHGYKEGFDDGYKEGYWDGYNKGSEDYSPGYTVVNDNDFANNNNSSDVHIKCGNCDEGSSENKKPLSVNDIRIKSPILERKNFVDSLIKKNFGPKLGGGSTKEETKKYVEEKIGKNINEIPVETIKGRSGGIESKIIKLPSPQGRENSENKNRKDDSKIKRENKDYFNENKIDKEKAVQEKEDKYVDKKNKSLWVPEVDENDIGKKMFDPIEKNDAPVHKQMKNSPYREQKQVNFGASYPVNKGSITPYREQKKVINSSKNYEPSPKIQSPVKVREYSSQPKQESGISASVKYKSVYKFNNSSQKSEDSQIKSNSIFSPPSRKESSSSSSPSKSNTGNFSPSLRFNNSMIIPKINKR